MTGVLRPQSAEQLLRYVHHDKTCAHRKISQAECDCGLNEVLEAYARAAAPQTLPKIICLCGSTRFYEHFQRANYDETMLGNIVLSVGFYPHAQKEMHHEEAGCTPEQKIALDELHKRKIDLADEVLVLNVGGYIGSSTRSEIDYAEAHGKPVRYLETELGVGESPAAAPRPEICEHTFVTNYGNTRRVCSKCGLFEEMTQYGCAAAPAARGEIIKNFWDPPPNHEWEPPNPKACGVCGKEH